MKIFLEDAKPQTLELEDDQDEEEENKKLEEKRAEFQFIQNVFDDAGVCAYSLGFIKAKTPLLYIYEAICLLINCLDFGNFKVNLIRKLPKNHVFFLRFK